MVFNKMMITIFHFFPMFLQLAQFAALIKRTFIASWVLINNFLLNDTDQNFETLFTFQGLKRI